LLEATDAEAERRGLTRSAFLTSAAIDKIEDSPEIVDATVRRLRAELAALHEKLAVQAAHFMSEMRRIGGRSASEALRDEERRKPVGERHRKARA